MKPQLDITNETDLNHEIPDEPRNRGRKMNEIVCQAIQTFLHEAFAPQVRTSERQTQLMTKHTPCPLCPGDISFDPEGTGYAGMQTAFLPYAAQTKKKP